MSRSVEVFVVDTPRAASVALGVVRADAESTHVLCRHQDEATPDFQRRVLRRIERIHKSRRVRSLWYVVGSDAARGRCTVPLLQSLLPLLESGSSLTVVGPGSHQSAVFEWIESIMHRRGNVTLRAQLYAEGEAPRYVLGAEAPLYVVGGDAPPYVVGGEGPAYEVGGEPQSKRFAAWFSHDAAGGQGAADRHPI